MALIENDIVITTKHARMPGFAACPNEPGRFRGIILNMDGPGLRACRRGRSVEQTVRLVGSAAEIAGQYSRFIRTIGRAQFLRESTVLKP